ncbi:alpha/beta hydrolase [Pararhodobacter sp.]|uniref:alpha/beta hydrolase n=1 Tax=Pararhodobacter sp. TaxID=2127056 RepID=UPI002FE1AC63
MAIETLSPAPQVNAEAQAYSDECLRRAALAVERGDCRYLPDIAYGPDPLQRLDIWAPKPAGAPAGLPVLVFFHGGNFTHGYKEWCAFMAPAITAFPALLVAAGYRHAPGTSYRAIIGDGLAALKLVSDRIAEWGGDPRRVWLGGHSAGAQMVCEIALDHERRAAAGLGDEAFRGVFPISGNYRRSLSALESDPALRQPEGTPDSPLDRAGAARHPFLLAWGGEEKPYVHEGGQAMAEAMEAAGADVSRLVIPGQDHFQVHLSCTEPGGAWLAAVQAAMTGAP